MDTNLEVEVVPAAEEEAVVDENTTKEETEVVEESATPEETPQEETIEEQPEETEEPAAPVEEQLHELPDGRKVPSSELAREWKENFMPDYTRKAQELSEYKKINQPAEEPKEEWQPQSYEEIVQRAKEEMKAEALREQQAAQEHNQQVEAKVKEDLEAIKKADPELNEDRLFEHAVKFGFTDLQLAHTNMVAMRQVVENTKKQTAEKIIKRGENPVATIPGGTKEEELPSRGDYENALDFFRNIKK